MMRHWREREFERHLQPPRMRAALRVWAFVARRPALYRLGARAAAAALGVMGRRRGALRALPLAGGWTASRDFPAPEGRTFQAQWRAAGRRGADR